MELAEKKLKILALEKKKGYFQIWDKVKVFSSFGCQKSKKVYS